jgi:hypothetical protein
MLRVGFPLYPVAEHDWFSARRFGAQSRSPDKSLRRRKRAWWLAVAVIAAQVAGNLANIVLGRVVEGAVGRTIAAALLFYLLRNALRESFE